MSSPTNHAINPGLRLLLIDMGISPDNVLRRAGLPRDLFVNGPSSLPSQKFFALWEAAEAETPDAHLPLLVGQAISLEAFDPPLFAASCSPNLNVAAERIAQHKKLISPMRLRVNRSGAETTIQIAWPPVPEAPPGLTLAELVFWVALARLATRHRIRPLRLSTQHPPEDGDAYTDYLGVAVDKSSTDSVAFSAEDATRPFLTANESMWEFFEPELRRRLSDLDAGTSVSGRVRASLLELLPAGDGSVQSVARELAMSTRTLQRRLNSEGTTFQDVLNDTRESLARHYLANSDMPASEISFLLGYEDPRSFYRAFQSWTGQTPRLVRGAAG